VEIGAASGHPHRGGDTTNEPVEPPEPELSIDNHFCGAVEIGADNAPVKGLEESLTFSHQGTQMFELINGFLERPNAAGHWLLQALAASINDVWVQNR
jgi:hypothetical protein